MFEEIKAKIEEYTALEFTRGAILGLSYSTKSTVPYGALADVLGTGVRQLGRMLGALMALDYAMNRAVTSSLVVNSRTGIPGEGYFNEITAHHVAINGPTLFTEPQLYAIWRGHLAGFPYVDLSKVPQK